MQLVGALIIALLLQLLPVGWMFSGVAPMRGTFNPAAPCECCPAAREASPSRCPGMPGCPASCPTDDARPATSARERTPDEVVNEQLGPMPCYPMVATAGPIVLNARVPATPPSDESDRRRATLGVWLI